jgi:FlaA1/EpsC-like NDP-sugar epimerase
MIEKDIRKIALVGAGDAAERFITTIHQSSLNSQFTFSYIFDDNENKVGSTIHGIKIVDTVNNIHKYKDSFDEIVVAIPSCSDADFNTIYNMLLKTEKKILTIPSLKAILRKPDSITSVRDVDIRDLIKRDEVEISYDEIDNYIKNKTVLVTGGAGSIGSMIIKLCLDSGANKVICIDSSEYNIYSMLQEQSQERLLWKVSDIKDFKMMDIHFEKYKPDIIFHAAALKHVNLQESNLKDCLLTNFYGTNNILKLAIKYNIENFVLISTDKAVEPINNMGLSKRMAEFLAYYHSNSSNTKMSVVRFGNVIGSSGSVLNYFSELIKNRKDIVVTHPEVSRFFMSIKEACYLVLQSVQSTEKKYQVFMLDMGEEILIKDIAERLILLSGLSLGKDINIKFSKLAKGEKIREKLNYSFETALPSDTSKLVKLNSSNNIDNDSFSEIISDLEDMIYNKDISDNEIISYLSDCFKELI